MDKKELESELNHLNLLIQNAQKIIAKINMKETKTLYDIMNLQIWKEDLMNLQDRVKILNSRTFFEEVISKC